jgi:hypothetical protein
MLSLPILTQSSGRLTFILTQSSGRITFILTQSSGRITFILSVVTCSNLSAIYCLSDLFGEKSQDS